MSKLDETDATVRWAADNDAYSGFDPVAYTAMVNQIAERPRRRLLWVTMPDAVADSKTTLDLYDEWHPKWPTLPKALVAQDGLTPPDVPWDQTDCLFIGGTTEWKLSTHARRVADAALTRGKQVHMGRVNTLTRLRYARAIGCHSVDGTGWSKWTEATRPLWITHLQSGQQLTLEKWNQ